MPTIKRIKGYRFFFFSNEGHEPLRIHIESGERYAKFWLEPVELGRSIGFHAADLTKLRKLVTQYQKQFMEAWYEHFGY